MHYIVANNEDPDQCCANRHSADQDLHCLYVPKGLFWCYGLYVYSCIKHSNFIVMQISFHGPCIESRGTNDHFSQRTSIRCSLFSDRKYH